ncbi:MAG: AAA family ATPase [Allosphingosinicella sp.]|uniref:AAA family ATPase n=1 Tax=Allosphingosinicella sp. TaxID=2823234 RepID=UPI00393A651B
MDQGRATLHMLCGKIAAGKSSLAARLAAAPATVLLAEDHLLARLYPGEIASLDDYRRCAGRLRGAIERHIVDLLKEGVSVVLDFQANTPAARAWMRSLFEAAGADHRLHWLDTPEAVCKARLAARNAAGTHDYQVSDEEFDLFTRHFVPPASDEGFALVVHPLPGVPRSKP